MNKTIMVSLFSGVASFLCFLLMIVEDPTNLVSYQFAILFIVFIWLSSSQMRKSTYGFAIITFTSIGYFFYDGSLVLPKSQENLIVKSEVHYGVDAHVFEYAFYYGNFNSVQDEVNHLNDELKGIPIAESYENFRRYARLVQLRPNNKRYIEKMNTYLERLSE